MWVRAAAVVLIVLLYLASMAQVRRIPGVLGYREPHFWTHTGRDAIGTMHVLVSEDCDQQHVLRAVSAIFTDIGVAEVAIQVETEAFFGSRVARNGDWDGGVWASLLDSSYHIDGATKDL